jgi:hypothetical protein
MQTVSLVIPRSRCYVAGDRYSIHGNGGSGEIDFSALPLVDGVPFCPGTRAHRGHLVEDHMCWGHLDHAVQDGHLDGGHLAHGHLLPEAILTFVTPPLTLGHFVLAVRTSDQAGNVSASPPAITACTINSSPRPAAGFRTLCHDPDTDTVTFAFRPSSEFA